MAAWLDLGLTALVVGGSGVFLLRHFGVRLVPKRGSTAGPAATPGACATSCACGQLAQRRPPTGSEPLRPDR